MAVTSDHIWYPNGGDSPAYDLRKIKNWHEKPGDPSRVLLHLSDMTSDQFFDSPPRYVEVDKAAFEAAKQNSNDNESSGGAEPDTVNGLWMWYDLNDISTVFDDGANITVSDKAGPWGHDSVGSTSAFDYGVHTINGKSTLSSKASGTHTTGTSTPAGTRESARRIMFLVAERINKGTGFTFTGGNTNIMFWRASGTLDDTFYHRSTADQVTEFRHQHDTTSIFGELSGPYLITAEWTNSGFDVEIYVNNVFWVSVSEGSGVNLSEGVRLINRATDPAPDVALAEVIQYTTDDGLDWTIGDPEYDDIVAYLNDKYSLGL